MTDTNRDYSRWIGRTESVEDDISLAPALAAAATVDDTVTQFVKGAALPPLWHWFYFLPRTPQAHRFRTPGACSLARACAFIDRSSSVNLPAERA